MDKLSEFQSLIDASKVLNKSGAKLIALEFVDRALEMDLPFSKERIVEVYKLRGKIRFGMGSYKSINQGFLLCNRNRSPQCRIILLERNVVLHNEST